MVAGLGKLAPRDMIFNVASTRLSTREMDSALRVC